MMENSILIDSRFSTTRRLSNESPSNEMNVESSFQFKLFSPESDFQIASGGLRTKGYFKTTFEDSPLISIVTVVYNGEEFLEETILSVINQNYDNVEYIIIDGGSTDGTLDIIKKYENQIDYWVSEPDKGIYDAMNKGIQLSSGEYIGIINSDDYYENKIFEKIFLVEGISWDLVYGHVTLLDENRQIFRVKAPKKLEKIKQEMCLFHPSTFVRKSAYLKHGLYDCDFSLASDYKFLLTLYLEDASFRCINENIAFYDMRGATGNNILKSWNEVRLIQKSLGFNAIKYNTNFLTLCSKRLILNCYKFLKYLFPF